MLPCEGSLLPPERADSSDRVIDKTQRRGKSEKTEKKKKISGKKARRFRDTSARGEVDGRYHVHAD